VNHAGADAPEHLAELAAFAADDERGCRLAAFASACDSDHNRPQEAPGEFIQAIFDADWM